MSRDRPRGTRELDGPGRGVLPGRPARTRALPGTFAGRAGSACARPAPRLSASTARRPRAGRERTSAVVEAPSATGRSHPAGLTHGAAEARPGRAPSRSSGREVPGASPRHALRCTGNNFDGEYERDARKPWIVRGESSLVFEVVACTSRSESMPGRPRLLGSVRDPAAARDARVTASRCSSHARSTTLTTVCGRASPVTGADLHRLASCQQLSATGSPPLAVTAMSAARAIGVCVFGRKADRRGGPRGRQQALHQRAVRRWR